MASTAEVASPTGIAGFFQSSTGRTISVIVAIAMVVGVMVGVTMWSQKPEYKVLFANFSDRDGGAIVASLNQMGVPYKFAEGGGAILVPSDQVYDARLKLASQGLPKGGNVGFELMENQKLGVSQFHEQVNFQRALEGELATSIQSLAAVQSARVHLALPKASVFVRDQQKPTASVILNLFPGRALENQQVSGIVHLVASSVPDLPTGNVSILDQNGNLLSDKNKPAMTGSDLDASQLKYVREIQQGIVTRIESILTPIVGSGNVRAEATAEVDFSRTEQAAETYKPNGTPTEATIRSQQTSESQNGGALASGVPGALSNQPPAPASAPLTAPGTPGAPTSGTPVKVQKDSTTNYEVDKTVKYVQQPMGGIKRLSVAVVVNYKKETDKNGKPVLRALTDAEKTQLQELVRDAMGFNKERGDSLNVLNTPFAGVEKEVLPELPMWKQPENIEMGKEIGKYVLLGIVLLYLFFGWLRPLKKKLMATAVQPQAAPVVEDAVAVTASQLVETSTVVNEADAYQPKLQQARELAKSDPKVVANVVKAWVNGNE